MFGHRLHYLAIITTACLFLSGASDASAAADETSPRLPQIPLQNGPTFSRELIGSIDPNSDSHLNSVKNGIKFDVYYNQGLKKNVAIYAINTGRIQLLLTPKHHQAILEDLLHRKFTVIVADFRDKKFEGVDLEKYVVRLTADAKAVADGVLPRGSGIPRSESATCKTDTFASDYFVLMPGFTIERDVTWFRYGDIPAEFRQAICRQLDKPFQESDAEKTNTYDIIYPAYGPAVGLLTNYGSNEKTREDYYALENRYLVQAFALKNLAIVHQQYFNDPVGGYPKGYGYYGDQFAVGLIRHLKGNADRYHLDTQRICCFGHSKGSELPGMLVNRLRSTPQYVYGKVDFKKLGLSEAEKTLRSANSNLSSEIAGAIFGAGVANNEMRSDKMLPWTNEPSKNISPFFVYADHVELIRERTRELVAKAKAHGVTVESTELDSHSWPHGPAYDQASAFADRILRLQY